MPDLKITRRRLPHWEMAGSTYFVTFRAASQPLHDAERKVLLDNLLEGAGRFYSLAAAVVMPDHSHILIEPNEGVDLSRIMKGIKGVSSRLINRSRGAAGNVWQPESFDRIVRDRQELDEKLRYMLNNPVKKGLVEDPWQYDGWYLNPDIGKW